MENSNLIKQTYNKCLLFSMLMIIPGSLGSIVDSVFIGALIGADGTAAYGLVMPTTLIVSALSMLLGNGGITLYLDHIGKGEKLLAQKNFSVIMLTTLIVSLILAGLGFFSADSIVAGLGAKGDKAYLLNYGSAYMRGIMLSVIPTMLCGSLDRYVRMDGDDKIVLFGTIGMGLTNIILDYILGRLMGMWGIGLATFICYLVYLAIMGSHLLRRDNHLKFTSPAGAGKEILGSAKVGSSSALMRVCQAVGMVIANMIILSYGAENLAASTVRNSVLGMMIFLSMGIEMATMLLTGMFYGERDRKELASMLRRSVITELIVMIPLSVLLFVFAGAFSSVFTHDPTVLAIAVVAMRWYAVACPFSTLIETLQYYYQGSQNVRMTTLIVMMDKLVLFIPVILILTKMFGVDGYWMSTLVLVLIMAVLLCIVAAVHNHHFPRSFEDWLMLKDDFEDDFDAVWSLTVKNDISEVVKISQDLRQFCQEHGVDRSRSYKIALSAEEMASNIVQHAFEKEGDHSIDMCVQLRKNGEIALRIRDNGQSFNPIAYVNNMEDSGNDEDLSNIGIRMVGKISKEMDYRFIGGLNNLLIIL